MLAIGTQAPDFTLEDHNGQKVSLHDFAGRKTVLYFYPKDFTPQCTVQAKAFRAFFEEYARLGAVIIGISRDSVKSHAQFAAKYSLPFILLSDPELEAVKAYEVQRDSKLLGFLGLDVRRATYVIGEGGKIAACWSDADAAGNAADVLSYLKASCPLAE